MKGLLKTFEVVIGLALVMLTFVALFTGQDPLPEFDTVSWKSAGTDALRALDASNELRWDVLNNNTAPIESKLAGFLPSSVDILVQVCDATCPVPEINADKSTTAHYLISGDAGNSTSKEVILYVWSDD